MQCQMQKLSDDVSLTQCSDLTADLDNLRKLFKGVLLHFGKFGFFRFLAKS